MFKQLVDRFTTSPLIGIDIGSSVVKVVELDRSEERILLRRCATSRVEGKDLADLLRGLLEKAEITATHVSVAIASPEVIVRRFEFPPMPRKELAKAIRLEAEQEIFNGKSQSEIDWQILPSTSEESLRGLLAVVPKVILANHLKVIRMAGLKPKVADVAGLALWNAYWALSGSRETSPKTVLLVNVGAKTTNLVIAKGPDELVLIRDLQLGGRSLADGHEKEWTTEISDSLGYARSQGGLRQLDAVSVTGGGSGPLLKPLLESAVTAPVTLWNPLNDVTCAPGLTVENGVGPLLAIAIGLALRQPA